MKLITIPENKFEEYKLYLIFNCYKWDPQFLDSNTIAKNILVLTEEEHNEIKALTELLDKETIKSENFLNKNLNCTTNLDLNKNLSSLIKKMSNYDSSKHVRLMRYDFHPTTANKWAVSEVNSDVPGGFAEGSLMPDYAKKLLKDLNYTNNFDYINFGDILIAEIIKKVKPKGTIALVHCTSYSDDRQVMEFLGNNLKTKGFKVIYCAADHINFINKEAFCILSGNETKIDFIFRYTPLEWLKDIKSKMWHGYFDCVTACCNHPISIFAQTKKFPFVWEILEKNKIPLKTWKKLLPKTSKINSLKLLNDNYIYKPALGRVGEKISIKEACSETEYNSILKDVKKHKNKYILQEKFISKPILTDDNTSFHVCLGSYTVNSSHAGYYARISNSPRIDSNAMDIPVLIERNKKYEE